MSPVFTVRPRRIALLVSIVLAALLAFVANYYAATFVSVGALTFAIGTLTFALSYTLADYIRRYHGRTATIVAVAAGAIGTLIYTAVFDGGLGRIVLASLASLVIASSVDIRIQTLLLGGPVWRLVLVSNGISLLIDTVVFTLLAFYGVEGVGILSLIGGDYLVKIIMSVISIPLIYAVTMVVPYRPLIASGSR
ncbi:MAG TPA: VUT family protein [Thermomicrobiales bacterium]|jgi:hypothetical protein|nr:VUT family protein [Thermomicrobiales bacterium]